MTCYDGEDFLQLSGLQHFLFCRRQWALIHVEDQWAENLRTADGRLMHERTHDETLTERRDGVITTRGMRVFSRTLGVSGQCDVLEFHRDPGGVELGGREGRWLPFPVEYKRGRPKENDCDAAQLCGQALCLEEMLCCRIDRGALFYGEPRRRTPVEFTGQLRALVTASLAEMHELYARGRTPTVKRSKACNACSLKDLCLPSLGRAGNVGAYIARSMEETR